MSTLTATYMFSKPEVGGDANAWGGMYNANMDALDTLLASLDFSEAAAKATPDDADVFVLWTGTPLSPRVITWAQIKAALATYFDSRYAVASQAEAEAGTDTTKRMTPLRTKQAIAALAPTADNWGTQVVVHNSSLTGSGTSGSPLGVV